MGKKCGDKDCIDCIICNSGNVWDTSSQHTKQDNKRSKADTKQEAKREKVPKAGGARSRGKNCGDKDCIDCVICNSGNVWDT